MSEPTRQQIKEAFNKTIERWERIVERPSYYDESVCKLCYLDSPNHSCNDDCPIPKYGDHTGCDNTPFRDFYEDKTPANALAELNFLRKVYIWWMEKEEDNCGWAGKLVAEAKKKAREEKKEKWERLTTKDLVVLIKECGEPYGCYLVITDNNEFRITAKRECYLDSENCLHMEFHKLNNPKYKLKVENGNFRILKKT